LELDRILADREMRDCLLMVFANKQDLPGCEFFSHWCERAGGQDSQGHRFFGRCGAEDGRAVDKTISAEKARNGEGQGAMDDQA